MRFLFTLRAISAAKIWSFGSSASFRILCQETRMIIISVKCMVLNVKHSVCLACASLWSYGHNTFLRTHGVVCTFINFISTALTTG